MNKKVLTLCAGFLLAGGMLSSVSTYTLRGLPARWWYAFFGVG